MDFLNRRSREQEAREGHFDRMLAQQPPVGLENWNNVCYLNASLQINCATGPLVDTVTSHSPRDCTKCNSAKFCLTNEMKLHIQRVSSHPGQIQNTPSLQSNLRSISSGFKLGEQQDAMEFYGSVVDKLCEENPKLGSVFKGKHGCTVICGDCGENSPSAEDFSDIRLDINNLKEKCHVETGLTHFFQLEVIDVYHCDKCHGGDKNGARKSLLIRNAPEVLTLQLNRFNPCENTLKINKLVSYPERLDISDYMENTKKNSPRKMYTLYGVLVHRGAFNYSGHYFAFVKRGKQWYRADDTRVREVSANTVLKQSGAYVLFYKAEHARKEDAQDRQKKRHIPENCDVKASSKKVEGIKSHAEEAFVNNKKACGKNNSHAVVVQKAAKPKTEVAKKIEVVDKKPSEATATTAVVVKECKNNVKLPGSKVNQSGVLPKQQHHQPSIANKLAAKKATQNNDIVKRKTQMSVVFKTSPQVTSVAPSVMQSFCGRVVTSSSTNTSLTSHLKCSPYLASVSMAPKPSTFVQPRIWQNIGFKKSSSRVPIQNGHIYYSSKATNTSGSNNNPNLPNCRFQVQPPTMSKDVSSAQSAINVTSDIQATLRTRYTAQKPVMSYVIPPVKKVAKKRKFTDITDSRDEDFGAKRQQIINVIRIPHGMVARQSVAGGGLKRRAVYQCINGPVVKVLKVGNSMCF